MQVIKKNKIMNLLKSQYFDRQIYFKLWKNFPCNIKETFGKKISIEILLSFFIREAMT